MNDRKIKLGSPSVWSENKPGDPAGAEALRRRAEKCCFTTEVNILSHAATPPDLRAAIIFRRALLLSPVSRCFGAIQFLPHFLNYVSLPPP